MEISENLLVRRLRKYGSEMPGIVRGMGDDGAVVRLNGGQYVFVQDAMVEHVHFEFSFLDPYFVGKKIIDINVSDVLSMGAVPLYYLVTIGIPDVMNSSTIDRLYRGMRQASRSFGLALIGGDTVQSQTFFIDISMTGRLVAKKFLGRNRAKDGDLLAVTGHLGEAAYGLQLLRQGVVQSSSQKFVKRFRDPAPPFALWKNLIKHDITIAMMDISDGFVVDLERMMAESGKAARVFVDKVPVPAVLRSKGLTEFALTGGEDYQFLFAFPKGKLGLVNRLKKEGYAISVVGEVKRGRGTRFFEKGKEVVFSRKGYEHFA